MAKKKYILHAKIFANLRKCFIKSNKNTNISTKSPLTCTKTNIGNPLTDLCKINSGFWACILYFRLFNTNLKYALSPLACSIHIMFDLKHFRTKEAVHGFSTYYLA